MKTGSCIVWVFYALLGFTVMPDVARLRQIIPAARNNASVAAAFYREAKGFHPDNALLSGYRAMSELLLCDHTANVIRKYAHFNEGRKLLEAAIKKEPANPELIYFRFTTQTSAPRMLGYYEHIKADKNLLLSFLKDGKRKDPQLYDLIKAYLQSCVECSKEEKDFIRQLDDR